MAHAWIICTYKRRDTAMGPTRYPAMDDFTSQIMGEGGDWSESEVLGGYAVVKVRASEATLSLIGGTAGYQRIPRAINLSDPLSALTNVQRQAIRTRLNDMGYSDGEIIGALGGVNLANVTLGQTLRFAASRRLKPRYDSVQDQIVLDGAYEGCRPIDEVDVAVPA